MDTGIQGKGSHLHGSSVNEQSIQILRSLGRSLGLAENDRSDASAGAVLVVGEHHPLHGTCRLCEVILNTNRISNRAQEFNMRSVSGINRTSKRSNGPKST